MASNLSTLGFDDSDPERLEQLLLKLAQSGTARLSTPVGDYAIWRSRTGGEIWFHLAPSSSEDESVEREIVGLTPYFEGTSEVPLNVTEIVKRPGDSMMEGAFRAWVAPDADGEGAYPIVFDAIDFAALAHRPLPERWRSRICGFARELVIFADETTYLAAQDDGETLASRLFVPVGLFASASQDSGQSREHAPAPTSHALIVGEVVASERLTNEHTDQAFFWMSVQSQAASFDVVVPSELVDGEIGVGSIVRAGCWLFGRAIT